MGSMDKTMLLLLLLFMAVIPQASDKPLPWTVTKKLDKCKGESAHFPYRANYSIWFARFGEKKTNLGPDPLISRVGKDNDYSATNSSYKHRVSYEGSAQNGSLDFIIHDVQVNDSRTFVTYVMIDVNGTPHNVHVLYELLVEECTNTVTEPPTPKPSSNGPDVMTTTHTSDPTVTSKPPATTIVPPTHANNTPLIAGFSTFAVLAFITGLIFGFYKWCNNRECQKKGREEEKTSVTSEGVSDYVDKQSGTPKEV